MTETVPLLDHLRAVGAEVDKRYQERYEAQQAAMTAAFVASREALSIKDRADREALELARAIQTYKDEKANELREQISRERGHYATKEDLRAAVEKIEVMVAPVLQQLAMQQGASSGVSRNWGWIFAVVAMVAALIGIYAAVKS
jgi:hypothetical protein